MDGDGDLDLVCPGKSGLYWFENPLKSGTAAGLAAPAVPVAR